jgi:hypothetical protein
MTSSRARVTGAVYLLYFLVVVGAVTLVGHVSISLSNAANLVANAVYVVVAVLLYQLLKPASRGLALLAVTISVVGCVVQSLSLFHIGSPRNSLPIFGLFNLTIGYLIMRSTFLPRVLGVLMVLSGIAWLLLLLPELSRHILTYIEIMGIVAEGALMLWLLVMGVDARRWNEQAAR